MKAFSIKLQFNKWQTENRNYQEEKFKVSKKIYCLLLLGPCASSAGGSFVPTAPMGGSDEWIVWLDGC